MNRKNEEAYESFNDPHLAQYFKRPSVRSHLLRAGLINELGHVIPGVTATITQERKLQLKKLLNDAINFMKNTSHSPNDDDFNSQVILSHLSSKLSSLEELKQLESMLRAYLVLEAKKSYTRKPLSGYRRVTTANTGQEKRRIHFDNNVPPSPANINYETVEIRSFAGNRSIGDPHTRVTSRSTPVSPVSMYTVPQNRPKSTYGLRRGERYSHEKRDKTNDTSVGSERAQKINGHSSKANTSSQGKLTSVTGATNHKVNSGHLHSARIKSINESDNLEIISLSDSDSWSYSTSSSSLSHSECLSYYSPKSNVPESARGDVLNYQHQSSSPLNASSQRHHANSRMNGASASSPSPYTRKSINKSISPHCYQRHTCSSRNSKQSTCNNQSQDKFNCKQSATNSLKHCNRKIPSAVMTLKYEVKCNLPVNRPNSSVFSSPNSRSMKLLKIYQQLTRGSASFLVCARYINSGSVFKFTVYRREITPQEKTSTFSLSVFFDSIRETRISTCCEFKHQSGTKISPYLTIINIKSLLHANDIVCNVCVKGLLWSEWLSKSLLDKQSTSNKQISASNATKCSQIPENADNDQLDTESRLSNCSVISERDYRQELAEYSQSNQRAVDKFDDDSLKCQESGDKKVKVNSEEKAEARSSQHTRHVNANDQINRQQKLRNNEDDESKDASYSYSESSFGANDTNEGIKMDERRKGDKSDASEDDDTGALVV